MLTASVAKNLVNRVISLHVSYVHSCLVVVRVSFALNVCQRNQRPTAHNSQNVQLCYFTTTRIIFQAFKLNLPNVRAQIVEKSSPFLETRENFTHKSVRPDSLQITNVTHLILVFIATIDNVQKMSTKIWLVETFFEQNKPRSIIKTQKLSDLTVVVIH